MIGAPGRRSPRRWRRCVGWTGLSWSYTGRIQRIGRPVTSTITMPGRGGWCRTLTVRGLTVRSGPRGCRRGRSPSGEGAASQRSTVAVEVCRYAVLVVGERQSRRPAPSAPGGRWRRRPGRTRPSRTSAVVGHVAEDEHVAGVDAEAGRDEAARPVALSTRAGRSRCTRGRPGSPWPGPAGIALGDGQQLVDSKRGAGEAFK